MASLDFLDTFKRVPWQRPGAPSADGCATGCRQVFTPARCSSSSCRLILLQAVVAAFFHGAPLAAGDGTPFGSGHARYLGKSSPCYRRTRRRTIISASSASPARSSISVFYIEPKTELPAPKPEPLFSILDRILADQLQQQIGRPF